MNLTSFIETAEPLGIIGLKITRAGEEIIEHHWEQPLRRNLYSGSKSFTSVAVGMARAEGLLTLDEKLTDVFADELPENVSENLAAATVRDLLTMHLGQDKAYLMGAQRPFYTEENWIRLALAQPFETKPNEKFVYSNVGPYLAGVLVQRRAGCTLVDYLMPRLFQPLGLLRPTWETDPLGYSFGAGGLMLNLNEYHKFGLLCLHDGVWEGKRLIPEGWIAECSRKQANGPYGYLFWRGEHNSFRADGMYGQYSAIFPDQEMVITIVSESRHAGKLLHMLHALGEPA